MPKKILRVLYAIQGTGNGHMARARAILPVLASFPGVELKVAVSGTQSELDLPVPVDYRFQGMSFTYTEQGGIDYVKTFFSARLDKIIADIMHFPAGDFDLILNDFEPVTAYSAKLKGVPCVDMSHQAGVRHTRAARPKKSDLIAEAVLRFFAPSDRCIGFHFDSFGVNYRTPIIRPEIRNLTCSEDGHILVYLPAYSPEFLFHFLPLVSNRTFRCFGKTDQVKKHQNVTVEPIDNHHFLDSFRSASGVLCSAGFELPAESLFHGKSLAVVPIKGQYEQKCNAAQIATLGVLSLKSDLQKDLKALIRWAKELPRIRVDYPDETKSILQRLFKEFPSQPDLPSYRRG